MAVVSKKHLLTKEIVADGTTVGETIDLPSFSSDFIITCEVSDRTDGTYTLTVQHSPDGINWFTLDSVAAISTEIMSIKLVTTQAFFNVRASVLATSVTDGATVDCNIWYNTKK